MLPASAFTTHPLTELVPEGSAGLASVLNIAARDLVRIGPDGSVTCVDKRERAPGPRELACRDRRLALRWTGLVQAYFQDAVHQLHGPIGGGGEVELMVGATRVHAWSIEPGREPVGCGRKDKALQQTQLTIDLTCAGEVAVVRYAIWRGFFNRPCDPAPRSTRAIGPDFTCPMGKDEANARVLDAGIVRVDLRSGVASPLALTRTQ